MSSLFEFITIRLFLVALLALQSSFVFSYDDVIERRISIGVRLFRTLLASDIHITQKVSLENQLNILLISNGDNSDIQHVSDQLENIGRGRKKGKIRGIPINILTSNIKNLQHIRSAEFAGIYIADQLSERQRQTVINFGITHQIIVYSPFEGDVEEGVAVGLAVGIKVLPFINVKALKKSNITIKALILRVAKIYEY